MKNSASSATRKTKLFPLCPPVLKWTGGKRWLIPQLRQIAVDLDLPNNTALIDLFAGGLSIPLGTVDFFGPRVIANDLNPYSINLYRRIQSGDFDKYCGLWDNNPIDFEAARNRFNTLNKQPDLATDELAQLMWYLSKTAFNGLFRMSLQNNYNSPFGSYERVDYERDLAAFADAVAGWQFSNLDFADVPTTSDSLIYADPPYYGKGVFTGYCHKPFNWDEQVRLATWLAAQPGVKIASNYPDPQILDLYGSLGFELRQVSTTSNISATTAGRGTRVEMLAIKVN